MSYFDSEFKREIQFMLERFLEKELSVVDGKIVGIPFVCQNIAHMYTR